MKTERSAVPSLSGRVRRLEDYLFGDNGIGADMRSMRKRIDTIYGVMIAAVFSELLLVLAVVASMSNLHL